MPMKRALYPENWDKISLAVRREAGWVCEWCGAENGKPNPATSSKVVLTVAHLDHNPANCARENLRALCQRCHLRYDAKQHARNAKLTRAKKTGQMWLPGVLVES